ncbi:PREDICTED: ankyrin [Prunus dulcis]|uniref:PREDICTED: ankyrin n=1 Tax=Prunus dulcis TaxID=3755 RepID=A0A5E4FAJ4_PRUDU|nr:PREDICTED: ankyrin [Prunus dulcis]
MVAEDFSSTPCPLSKESHHEKVILQTGDAHGDCGEDFTSPAWQLVSASFKTPSLDALEDSPEAKQKYFKKCVPLHLAAVNGSWEAAKRIMNEDDTLLHASITKGWQTVLHVAAGAKHVHFVKELLKLLDERDLELQDQKGNTAFYHAVAAGTIPVAKILMQKNPRLLEIRGGQGLSPLYYAALFGHDKMASYLYPKLIELVNEEERAGIFFSCINNGLYELALKMLKEYPALAVVRNANSETALHLLAQKPSAFSIKTSRILKNFLYSCTNKRNLTTTPCYQLLKCLWEKLLLQNDSTLIDVIRRPSNVLFIATKLGNFKFVAELIGSYPDLIWETDDSNQSLFHIAVAYHQASIFSQAQKLGLNKNIVLSFIDDKNNNILHLAAKLAPPNQLNTGTRSTIQMKRDLSWFKEVKKFVPPSYQEMKNSEGKTPKDIFIEEHKMFIGKRSVVSIPMHKASAMEALN